MIASRRVNIWNRLLLSMLWPIYMCFGSWCGKLRTSDIPFTFLVPSSLLASNSIAIRISYGTNEINSFFILRLEWKLLKSRRFVRPSPTNMIALHQLRDKPKQVEVLLTTFLEKNSAVPQLVSEGMLTLQDKHALVDLQ
jgi:hypothetical protein